MSVEISNLAATAESVVAQVASERGHARLLGGLGIVAACPSARPGAPLARTCGDMDFAVRREDRERLAEALEAHGFHAESRFNAIHGHRRMLFVSDAGVHADVFVDTFAMCHTLPLRNRLALAPLALTPVDLLLTKLQIAELNVKDVADIAALLVDHPLVDEGDAGINRARICKLLSQDWGWWRTATAGLEAAREHVPGVAPTELADRVAIATTELRRAIDGTSKSIRWKARARVGERVPWRDDPEET